MGRAVRSIECFLFAVGFVILGYCGAAVINSRVEQAKGNYDLNRLLRTPSTARVPEARLPDGALVGKVEIPDLRLSAVVFQGTDDSVLDQGVGHVDDSALPGQPGNVVLAAHRDTFFRDLRNVHKGELVRVTTPSGIRTYSVESTEVVDPTQTSVMDATPSPTLTLITCYPFYYVGHAPKRFIVRARDISYQAPQLVAAAVSAPQRTSPDYTYVFKASE